MLNDLSDISKARRLDTDITSREYDCNTEIPRVRSECERCGPWASIAWRNSDINRARIWDTHCRWGGCAEVMWQRQETSGIVTWLHWVWNGRQVMVSRVTVSKPRYETSVGPGVENRRVTLRVVVQTENNLNVGCARGISQSRCHLILCNSLRLMIKSPNIQVLG